MPNTLAHFAVQGAMSKAIARDIDWKWILLACVLPDVPWIMQRAALVVLPSVDPFDLRLYASIQASLLFCWIAAFGVACMASRFWAVFAVLAVNAPLHLLLDAMEIKWGNGVHVLAPFSWQMINFGLVWPEHPVVTACSLLGLALGLFVLLSRRSKASYPAAPGTRTAALILAVYAGAPLLMLDQANSDGNHYVSVLSGQDERAGAYVELDRLLFRSDPPNPCITTYADECIRVIGHIPEQNGVYSIKGRFADDGRMQILEFHRHWRSLRELFSIVGLLILGLIWIAPLAAWTRRTRL